MKLTFDYKIYCLLSREHAKDNHVSGHVYINADADKCFERINKRSRSGEGVIELSYLKKCKDYHDNWLGNYTKWDPNTTTTDVTILDINTNADATYTDGDANDPGNEWILQIERFIQHIISLQPTSPRLPPPPNSPVSV